MSQSAKMPGQGLQAPDLFFSLVNWGRAHLLEVSDEEREAYRKQTLEAWGQALEPEADLWAGWRVLQQLVQHGVAALSSATTIDLDPSWSIDSHRSEWEEDGPESELSDEEKTREEVSMAYHHLDLLVFFIEGLTAFVFPEEKTFPELQQEANKLYNESTLDPGLPCWRFIPLNGERNVRLRYIPKEARYLFPWYKEWSDVPDDTLEVVIRKLAGEPLDTSRICLGDFVRLTADIEDDSAFRHYLLQEALTLKMMKAAIPHAYALRWLLGSEKEAGRHPWSAAVHAFGGVNASVFVRCRDILSGKDWAEGLFRLAACGINLSSEDRLKIFHLLEADLKAGRYLAKEGEFFRQLIAWMNGKITGQELLGPIFDSWHQDMEAVATTVRVAAAYTSEDLMDLAEESPNSQAILESVRPLLGIGIGQPDARPAKSLWRTFCEDFQDFAQQLVAPINWGFAPGILMAGPGDVPQHGADQHIQQTHQLKQPANGDLFLFGPDSTNPGYEKARTTINNGNHFYWLAVYGDAQEVLRINGPGYGDQLTPIPSLPAGSWQGPVLLLISSEEERLRDIHEILKSEEISMKEVVSQLSEKVLLIIYTPPEEA